MACTDCDTPPVPCTGCGNKCHEVVDTYAEVQEFRNAFVTVRDENAVYHVDDIGNPVAVSRSAIFKNSYTPVVGDYKQNVVYDFVNEVFYVFDPSGQYKTGTLS
jgi:hypothetical protein